MAGVKEKLPRFTREEQAALVDVAKGTSERVDRTRRVAALPADTSGFRPGLGGGRVPLDRWDALMRLIAASSPVRAMNLIIPNFRHGAQGRLVHQSWPPFGQ